MARKNKLENKGGIAFSFSGRAYGSKKAASFKILLGSIPTNTLKAEIDYANMMQKTKNGT
jgi:ribosomal protein S3